jgi:hypothetical protein
LLPNLPEAETDVESMTQAFIEARYTEHSIRPDNVGTVQNAWERIRSLLKQRRDK